MKIVNAMFGRGRGGVEHSFVGYCRCLRDEGHDVTVIVSKNAAILDELKQEKFNVIAIRQWGGWDPLAKYFLKRILKKIQPDLVIAHVNRAVQLLRPASSGNYPVTGVVKNYKYKHAIGCDAIITTTQDLRKHIHDAGQPKETIHIIPNMVSLPGNKPEPYKPKNPIVIGSIGRFVMKKGYEDMLKALAVLKQKGHDFEVIIAGSGEEENNLKEQTERLFLNDRVHFPGWVSDIGSFYNDIDIFCLPSLHEPFGIVLIEAFAHSKPVVSTRSEGPLEIAEDHSDILFCDIGNSEQMADMLEDLIEDKKLAAKLAENGFNKAQNNYSLKAIGKALDKTVKAITAS